MYIGATNIVQEEFFIIKDGKFTKEKIAYVPAIFKIINEILDNSIDNFIETRGKYANKIKVHMTPDFVVTIQDNGTGIPVQKNDNGEWIPKMCFGKSMAGSNFNENRVGAGMNGVGAFACNVFSKIFTIRDVDLEDRRYEAIWKDNGIFVKDKVGKRNNYTHGVTVKFQIDLDRFNIDIPLEELYHNTMKLIEQRLINIAGMYNDLTFTLNNETIRFKNPKEFISYFGDLDQISLVQTDKYFIAVLPSETDDFQFHTYVNQLFLKAGGTHIDLITDEIVKRLREKLSRRYKKIKPGDIKNKLFVIAFFKDFPNFKTDSQTKERLKNSNAEIREYLGDFDFGKFVDKIYKQNKALIEEITLRYKIAQEMEERKAAKKATKGRKKDIAKYWKPSKDYKYMVFTEGDSAIGAIMAATDRENKGFFPLRGKIINAIKQPLSKIIKNDEIMKMAEILGIDISDPNNNQYSYETVVIATDADVDGQSITALLLAFFYKFAPDLLLQNRIAILRTPIAALYKKGTEKVEKFIFDFSELNDLGDLRGITVGYKKGLGSLYESDWEELFKRYSFEDLLQYITVEDAEREFRLLEMWMDEDREFRKEILREEIKNFDINRV